MNEQYLAPIHRINVDGNKKSPIVNLQQHLYTQGFKNTPHQYCENKNKI